MSTGEGGRGLERADDGGTRHLRGRRGPHEQLPCGHQGQGQRQVSGKQVQHAARIHHIAGRKVPEMNRKRDHHICFIFS